MIENFYSEIGSDAKSVIKKAGRRKYSDAVY